MTNPLSKTVLLFVGLLTIATQAARLDAILLGNIIGCNTFACRLSAVENDVSQLKQQVARMSTNSNANTYNHNPGYPNNLNPSNQGGFSNSQFQPSQQQQQQGQNQQGNNQQLNNQNQNQLAQPSQQNVQRINNFGNLNEDTYATPYRRVPNFSNNQFFNKLQ